MERSTELQAVTLSLYEAMSKGQIDILLNQISKLDGILCIGTDEKEWWPGHKTLRKIFEAQFSEMGQLSFSDCNPEAYFEGSVGWAADRPKMNFADGTQIPMRGTFVFHQENGDWKVIQMHWSLGIDNEVSVGKELTTE